MDRKSGCNFIYVYSLHTCTIHFSREKDRISDEPLSKQVSHTAKTQQLVELKSCVNGYHGSSLDFVECILKSTGPTLWKWCGQTVAAHVLIEIEGVFSIFGLPAPSRCQFY